MLQHTVMVLMNTSSYKGECLYVCYLYVCVWVRVYM
jgi:hypothetical protein